MWAVLGPRVITWAAPRTLRAVAVKTFGLTAKQLEAADGNPLRAIAVANGEAMAQAIYGSLGKITQEIPTGQLDELAQKYGFPDAATAAKDPRVQQLIGGGGFDPAGIGGVLQAIGGGKDSGFTKIASLMSALGGLGGMSGGNDSRSPNAGAASSAGWASRGSAIRPFDRLLVR